MSGEMCTKPAQTEKIVTNVGADVNVTCYIRNVSFSTCNLKMDLEFPYF